MIKDKEHIESTADFQERPRICLIDLDDNEVQALRSRGYNCTIGSFGSQIDLPPYVSQDHYLCLPNQKLPNNLHEYDIMIVDLKDNARIRYVRSEHQYSSVKGDQSTFFLCEFPRTVFDPRPLSAKAFEASVGELKNKKSIVILFSAAKETVSYTPTLLTASSYRRYKRLDKKRYHNYSFLPSLPYSVNKVGRDTTVVSNIDESTRSLLQKYNKDFRYFISFEHPTRWVQNESGHERIKNENFYPLIVSPDDRIVSYAEVDNDSLLLLFPQLEDKTNFLIDLFQRVLPALTPNLFPHSTEFAWLNKEEYRLPYEMELLREKERLENEYALKLEAAKDKISENYSKYSFLHDLLTQTSDKLVKNVENYFKWLEFEKVINLDEVTTGPNEEDLQVVLDQGLLVVEVKGIGGTSTDSDCSQINKIKYRRAEERGAFDVFALYIVNHQRYLPPKDRVNPPFSKQQIKDAKNGKRGLLTTYNLFKLYFFINDGYITKTDARKALLKFGHVTFKPSNAASIGRSIKIFKKGAVGVFAIENVLVRLNGEVLIFENETYSRAKVVGIQANGVNLDEASNGEIGLKFSTEITKKSEIWVLNK